MNDEAKRHSQTLDCALDSLYYARKPFYVCEDMIQIFFKTQICMYWSVVFSLTALSFFFFFADDLS